MRETLRFPPKVFQRAEVLSRFPQLRKLFSREGVLTAYLFGSVYYGQAQPGSDLDIAIEGEEDYEWSKLYGEVYQGLCELLEADNIDLVILNEASLSLRLRAQGEGFTLYTNRDEVIPPKLVQPVEEPFPLGESSPSTVLGEVLQGLRGRMGADPNALRMALRRGIRAAFVLTKWVIEGVCWGEYERLTEAEEVLKDGVSPFGFSDWIAALLAIRKVMVHLLWKLEAPSLNLEDIPTFTHCFSRVLSYLDFALE